MLRIATIKKYCGDYSGDASGEDDAHFSELESDVIGWLDGTGCRRHFALPAEYVEVLDGPPNGSHSIVVRGFIRTVTAVRVRASLVSDWTDLVLDDDPAVSEVEFDAGGETVIRKASCWPPGIRTAEITYTAGYTQALAIGDAIGDEVLSAPGWTSTDWTGSYVNGWMHTAGNTSVLSNATASEVDAAYLVTYTVTNRTAGSFTVGLGGASTAGGLTASGTATLAATTVAGLSVTPTSAFDGTIVLSVVPVAAVASDTDAPGELKKLVRNLCAVWHRLRINQRPGGDGGIELQDLQESDRMTIARLSASRLP